MRHKVVFGAAVVLCMILCGCSKDEAELAYKQNSGEIDTVNSADTQDDSLKIYYDTLLDYVNIVDDGKIAKFVEPSYIIGKNGEVKSEENAIYFTDVDDNECLLSIQYDISNKMSSRTLVYRVRYKQEKDDKARERLKDIGKYITEADVETDIEEVFNNTVKKYTMQLYVSSKDIDFEKCKVNVTVKKALEEDCVGYTLSVKTSWNSGIEILDDMLAFSTAYKKIIGNESEQSRLVEAMINDSNEYKLRLSIDTSGAIGIGLNTVTLNGASVEMNSNVMGNDTSTKEFIDITGLIGSDECIDKFKDEIRESKSKYIEHIDDIEDLLHEETDELVLTDTGSVMRIVKVNGSKIFEIEK